ncbi:MAG: polyphenol oxidoreductase [Ignavibacteria bacterium RBG_16_36_9]|nr:MAG: polyphenol oxidoreductase [Ignavibacteria bacterium RBG_16_36_9]
MLIIKPFIFKRFSEIVFGFSTKIGSNAKLPYHFNLSYSIGDEKEIVDSNRKLFFRELGLNEKMISYQKQVHEDKISMVNSFGSYSQSDALVTKTKNLGLAISSADCPAIFIYDPIQRVIAAVHSGWKGTEKKILAKTIQKLKDDFQSDPLNLICYIGPSISQNNYEVGEEVASKFDKESVSINENKFYLNLSGANYKMLIDEGVKEVNIQVSGLCTYEYENLLHSYRRDGQKSGRALGVIAMMEKD